MTIDDAIWILLDMLNRNDISENEKKAMRCAINSMQIEKELRRSLKTQMWNEYERRGK